MRSAGRSRRRRHPVRLYVITGGLAALLWAASYLPPQNPVRMVVDRTVTAVVEQLPDFQPQISALNPYLGHPAAGVTQPSGSPLTLILVAPRRGTIAFRVPDHPVARRLIAASGGGLPVTSANRSGHPDCHTADEVLEQLDGRVALILDGGRTAGDKPSTIVDCTTEHPVIKREGMISADEIERVLRQVQVA